VLIDEKLQLFVVADGMGGHASGEVASRLAVESLQRFLLERMGSGAQATTAEVARNVREAFECAGDAVVQHARRTASDMATTMTVAVVHGRELVLGHVGDSRAYKISDTDIRQVSEDHSLVAQMVRDGLLSPEDAEQHPKKHIVVRAIGPQVENSSPDVTIVPLDESDSILLCSDGLSNVLPPDEMFNIVQRHDAPDKAAQALVDAANAKGGPDNISAVLIQGPWDTPGAARSRSSHLPLRGLLIAVALFALAGLGRAYVIHHFFYLGVSDGKVAIYPGLARFPGILATREPHRVTKTPVEECLSPYQDRLVRGIQFSSIEEATRGIAGLQSKPPLGVSPFPSSDSAAASDLPKTTIPDPLTPPR